MVLLSQYVYEVRDGTIRPGAPFTVLRETGSTAVVDCGFNFGLVSAKQIADLVVEKARSAHIACVVSQRTHHVSRLGSHVQKLADSGFIGLGYVAASTQYWPQADRRALGGVVRDDSAPIRWPMPFLPGISPSSST